MNRLCILNLRTACTSCATAPTIILGIQLFFFPTIFNKKSHANESDKDTQFFVLLLRRKNGTQTPYLEERDHQHKRRERKERDIPKTHRKGSANGIAAPGGTSTEPSPYFSIHIIFSYAFQCLSWLPSHLCRILPSILCTTSNIRPCLFAC